jgi:hypothetical protein
VIFSVQISQEIIKLCKIGKRDLHIILKVLPNEIIKKYCCFPLNRPFQGLFRHIAGGAKDWGERAAKP